MLRLELDIDPLVKYRLRLGRAVVLIFSRHIGLRCEVDHIFNGQVGLRREVNLVFSR